MLVMGAQKESIVKNVFVILARNVQNVPEPQMMYVYSMIMENG
jgi:hypothetical protein